MQIYHHFAVVADRPDVDSHHQFADGFGDGLPLRKYIEVKPNTPSGRAAAARLVRKYEEATDQKVRALFYDLKRFI